MTGQRCRTHRQRNSFLYPEIFRDDAWILRAVGGAGSSSATQLLQQLGFFLVSDAQDVGQSLMTIVLQPVLEPVFDCAAQDAGHATADNVGVSKCLQ